MGTVILREIRFLSTTTLGILLIEWCQIEYLLGSLLIQSRQYLLQMMNLAREGGGRVSLLKDGDIKSGWEVLRYTEWTR